MGNAQFTKDLPLWAGLTAALPMVILQSNETSTTGDAETIDVTGSSITIPQGFFAPGTTFRYTLYGSRTGTAGAATILVDIAGTTVATIAIPTDTAVDWKAVIEIAAHTDFAHQNVSETVFTSATVLTAYDTATGTVNVAGDVTMKAQMTLASASDSVTCSHVRLECWKL